MVYVIKIRNNYQSSIDYQLDVEVRVGARVISYLNHHLVFKLFVSNKMSFDDHDTFGLDLSQPVVDV